MSSREQLEQVIEHCIDLLNVIDGDPDLECGGDLEPGSETEEDDCRSSLVNLAGIDGENWWFGERREPKPEAVKQVKDHS